MKLSVIHQTDLFRPHQDPDDHWDLACVFALAAQGYFDLKGILIDFPPDQDKDPDIAAVSQLNHIYGLNVPAVVGSSVPLKSRGDSGGNMSATERRGVDFILDTLKSAENKVAINIVGSCRDVALAINSSPDLFQEKCAAIYLNAGYGTQDSNKIDELEYNVRLNKEAYATIFDAACPLYWCPCFEDDARHVVKEWGTNWGFRHADVLNDLPIMLQRFFVSMYNGDTSSNWLQYLLHQDVSEQIDARREEYRNMWSTAGILHMAGKSVDAEGGIRDLGEINNRPVHQFESVQISCDDEGITRWTPDRTSTKRYIFHILELNRYQSAMTRALKHMLEMTL